MNFTRPRYEAALRRFLKTETVIIRSREPAGAIPGNVYGLVVGR